MTFPEYIRALNDEAAGRNIADDWVPASTYFLIDGNGIIYGAVNIRHALTESLRVEGGHIGYGVRPKARGNGYATKMLAMALEKLKAVDVTRALLTCDKNNAASAGVLHKNVGVLDSEMCSQNSGRIIW